MQRFLILAATLAASGSLRAAEAGAVDFSHEIVPLLRQQCADCHLGDKKKGGFSMNTREDLLAGSENGPVLELGKGAESLLVEVLATTDTDIQMPPKGARLTKEQVDLIRRWIDSGLKWEAGFSFGKAGWEPPLKPRRVELPPAVSGRDHPVDRILDAYLAQTGGRPADPVADAVFLRRLHLDTIGLLPTPGELEAFLADPAADKREKAIDAVLARDIDYAEHWLTFWNDLLRNDYAGTGYIDGGRKQITDWLYRSLVNNKPYDQFVRELISPAGDAEGFIRGIQWRGRVNASQTREIQFAENLSQVFLGINMKCASCHDSFIDRWKLKDAYGLAAIFATEPVEIHRCDMATGEKAKPAWIFPELGDVIAEAPQPERLAQLARLMTHPENGRFTRTLVNRVWHRMMGRGIVHPVDAMHTEPWSEDLLDWLAVDFAENGYDFRKLLRRIATSRAYQSPMAPTPDEADAGPYVYRGPIGRRMTAEQFIDAVWSLTGTAPAAPQAEVLRLKIDPAAHEDIAITGRWIWAGRDGTPAAGETISLRGEWVLAEKPAKAFAAASVDNEYTLYVNGRKVKEDQNWETVDPIDLSAVLRKGKNEFLLIAKNGGQGPNLAGAFLEVRVPPAAPGGADQRFATGPDWQWSATLPDVRGKFAQPVTDWAPAREVAGPWGQTADSQTRATLARAANNGDRLVRASLMRSDLLMRSLGRPNREQVVTVRPAELSTLQAIDLANGEILAGLLSRGGAHQLAANGGKTAREVVDDLFLRMLSRPPTTEEQALLSAMAGSPLSAQGLEDVLWAILMLPEFQLVR
ncbi:MAG: DUF1549 domain-containing protein [Verrucomicrobiales bacterium]|nr:DUF1549 domain-containing protein [Verrucomicrobiales bacterium]